MTPVNSFCLLSLPVMTPQSRYCRHCQRTVLVVRGRHVSKVCVTGKSRFLCVRHLGNISPLCVSRGNTSPCVSLGKHVSSVCFTGKTRLLRVFYGENTSPPCVSRGKRVSSVCVTRKHVFSAVYYGETRLLRLCHGENTSLPYALRENTTLPCALRENTSLPCALQENTSPPTVSQVKHVSCVGVISVELLRYTEMPIVTMTQSRRKSVLYKKLIELV